MRRRRRSKRQFRTIVTVRARSERGVAMLSTLIVVIILGVIVTVAIADHSSTSPSSSTNAATVTNTTAPTAKTVGSDSQASTVAACEANFSELSTAITTYRALHGGPPPAGTAWATSTTDGAPILQSWSNASVGYQIEWNGVTLSVVPSHGTPSHGSFGTQSPATGCFSS